MCQAKCPSGTERKSEMNFKIDNFYNPHLSIGASRLDAILSVTASSGEGEAIQSNLNKAIIFVIDQSGSMESNSKMEIAKVAVRRSIDLLDETSYFAIITFSNDANVITPLMQATKHNKEAAHYSVKRLRAFGGTQMSRAILAVLDMVSGLRDNCTCSVCN
jgi:Mg-chelatase subunit ChlD